MAECNELAQFVFEIREVITDEAYLTSMNNIAKIKKELDHKNMIITELSNRINTSFSSTPTLGSMFRSMDVTSTSSSTSLLARNIDFEQRGITVYIEHLE